MTLEQTSQGCFVDGLRVNPDTFARYKAARDREVLRLAASAPLRGANHTGRDQAGTHGLALFDRIDAPGLF